jgi:hypothetical protein
MFNARVVEISFPDGILPAVRFSVPHGCIIMLLGRHQNEPEAGWVATAQSTTSSIRPSCRNLNALLAETGFDAGLEISRGPNNLADRGRASISNGDTFPVDFAACFGAIRTRRGIAGRRDHRRPLADFSGQPIHELAADHPSSFHTTGRLPVEPHEATFDFVLMVAARCWAHGLVKVLPRLPRHFTALSLKPALPTNPGRNPRSRAPTCGKSLAGHRYFCSRSSRIEDLENPRLLVIDVPAGRNMTEARRNPYGEGHQDVEVVVEDAGSSREESENRRAQAVVVG